jgi:acetyl esterase/lipase
MADDSYLSPFVLSTPTVARDRSGGVDLYLPDADEPRPAVVFLHGGLITEDMTPPSEWPVYVGYASVAAARGVVGVMLDHPLRTGADLPRSAETIAAAVSAVRQHPRVDPDRIALWACSAGATLLGDWLRESPQWLRCVAASYPLFTPFAHWTDDPRFSASDALHAGCPPLVVTIVGRDGPNIAATQPPFLATARALRIPLDVIEVPDGRHSFDMRDHTDESRRAVERAFDLVVERVVADGDATPGAGPVA